MKKDKKNGALLFSTARLGADEIVLILSHRCSQSQHSLFLTAVSSFARTFVVLVRSMHASAKPENYLAHPRVGSSEEPEKLDANIQARNVPVVLASRSIRRVARPSWLAGDGFFRPTG